MSDLIDRQAAIDALHTHLMYRMGTDSNKKRLDDWINSLPSAQPEVETQMSLADCISRQDALDAIDRITRTDNWQAAVSMALLDLPSAQPETNYSEFPNNSDIIYRQAAIAAIDKRFDDVPMELTTEILQLRRDLREMPSAQPKTGKWIPTQNPQWKAYYHDKCSVCGWWNTKNAVCRDSKKKAHSLNYCPNCGTMMKEGEEHDQGGNY